MLSKKNLLVMMAIVLLLSIFSCKNKKDVETSTEEKEKDAPSELLLLETEDGEIKIYALDVQSDYEKKLVSTHAYVKTAPSEYDALKAVVTDKLRFYLIYNEAIKNKFHLSKNIDIAQRYFTSTTKRHIIEQELDRVVRSKITQEDLDKVRPEIYRSISIRQILLPTREKAEKVLKLAKAGEDFIELVKKYSRGPRAFSMKGLTKPFVMGALGYGIFTDKEDERAAFTIDEGKIHDGVVDTPLGYLVYKIHKVTDFDEEQKEKINYDADERVFTFAKAKYSRDLDKRYKDNTKVYKSVLYKATVQDAKGILADDTVVAKFNEDIKITFFDVKNLPAVRAELEGADVEINYALFLSSLAELIARLKSEDLFLKDERAAEKEELLRYIQYKELLAILYLNMKFRNIYPVEEEIKDYYDRNPNQFRSRPFVKLATIHTHVKSVLYTVIEKLKAGEDFGELAETYSIDEKTKDERGELGWIGRGLLDVSFEFENQIFAMEIGELSDPVEGAEGFFIIRVLDKKEAGKVMDYETAKPIIWEEIYGRSKKDAIIEYINGLYNACNPVWHDENLGTALAYFNKQKEGKEEKLSDHWRGQH